MGTSSPKHARRQILQFSEVSARMCVSLLLIPLEEFSPDHADARLVARGCGRAPDSPHIARDA
eukprot:6823134-Heterocapsa_arctica.AAC.1